MWKQENSSATGLCISRTYVSPATTIRAKSPAITILATNDAALRMRTRDPRVLTVDVLLARVPAVLLPPPVLVTTLPWSADGSTRTAPRDDLLALAIQLKRYRGQWPCRAGDQLSRGGESSS